MNFLAYLETVIEVSGSLRKRIESMAETRSISKGETIVNKGQRCNELFFVEKGLLRGFYFLEEKEVTNWFAREGEFATCFYSFISKELSFETIQALEDTTLIAISYSNLQTLYMSFPETERIGRIFTESYYIKLEERLLSIQFKTAKERYARLLEADAALLQRASLGQIASYLGITQETLSRIRADI